MCNASFRGKGTPHHSHTTAPLPGRIPQSALSAALPLGELYSRQFDGCASGGRRLIGTDMHAQHLRSNFLRRASACLFACASKADGRVNNGYKHPYRQTHPAGVKDQKRKTKGLLLSPLSRAVQPTQQKQATTAPEKYTRRPASAKRTPQNYTTPLVVVHSSRSVCRSSPTKDRATTTTTGPLISENPASETLCYWYR